MDPSRHRPFFIASPSLCADSPDALYFEIYDSFRRIIMQGVLTFASLGGWKTGPVVIGIILSLSTLIVVREVAYRVVVLRRRVDRREIPAPVGAKCRWV